MTLRLRKKGHGSVDSTKDIQAMTTFRNHSAATAEHPDREVCSLPDKFIISVKHYHPIPEAAASGAINETIAAHEIVAHNEITQ